MDIPSSTQMTVRLAGTAVVDAFGEIKGSHAEELYRDQPRKIAIATAWSAVSHPCGYVVKRVFRNQNGLIKDGGGIVLPLATNTNGSKSVIGYNVIPNESSEIAAERQIEAVQDFQESWWIDIGAGCPLEPF